MTDFAKNRIELNLLSVQKEVEVLLAVRKNFVSYLAEQYSKSIQDACEIAGLCDVRLDPSGALLGEVRDAAIALTRG